MNGCSSSGGCPDRVQGDIHPLVLPLMQIRKNTGALGNSCSKIIRGVARQAIPAETGVSADFLGQSGSGGYKIRRVIPINAVETEVMP